jgi:outer membrane protein assembly factor BamB
LDYPGGERLAKVDFTKAFGKTIWELLTFGGISAAPAVMEDAIYAGTEDARVFAVSPDRQPIWSTEGNIFRTEGPIVADLKSDDTGVYVACTDSKLYCIDRASGRLKWQYFAGTPLRTQPVVTADAVYQFVPGKGLVAIDKATGKDFREPRWVAPAAGRFLSQDDNNVYVRSAEGNVAALDRKTGEPRFKSRRSDITVFAWPNTKDSMIYGATPRGEVIAIKPVTTPGTMGQVVMNETRSF